MPYNEAGKMIHYKYFGLIGLSEVIYDNKTTAKVERIFCFRLVPIIKQLTEDFPIKVTFWVTDMKCFYKKDNKVKWVAAAISSPLH